MSAPKCFVIGLSLLALGFFVDGAYIHAKAWLAQQLIAKSWQDSLQRYSAQEYSDSMFKTDLMLGAQSVIAERQGGFNVENPRILSDPVKPWSWADTWPIARLSGDQMSRDLYVLADASGQSLAFGPGHIVLSAFPGESGEIMIAGHRDTHFAFVQHLQLGHELRLQTQDSRWHCYRVLTNQVVDTNSQQWTLGEGDFLQLVTCYPFEGVAQTSLRYVVSAESLGLCS